MQYEVWMVIQQEKSITITSAYVQYELGLTYHLMIKVTDVCYPQRRVYIIEYIFMMCHNRNLTPTRFLQMVIRFLK